MRRAEANQLTTGEMKMKKSEMNSMTIKSNATYLGALLIALTAVGCGKSDEAVVTAAVTPLSVTEAVTLIQDGVETTGTGIGGGSASRLKDLLDAKTRGFSANLEFVAALCDEHGIPLLPAAEGGTYMQGDDDRYPAIKTYCNLTVDDGETVRGGFGTTRSLICSLEEAGLQFAGVEQTLNISFSEACWPNGGPEGDGVSTLEIVATGSSPASFNTYFEKGVIFEVPTLGLTYKLGANVASTKIEFLSQEHWTTDGEQGVMAGSIDRSTGVLLFEKRDERIGTCNSNRCGWNRHTRLLANLTMVDNKPTGLTSVELGYADTEANSSNHSAKVITAKGSLADGIKARIFTYMGSANSDLKVLANWTGSENTNTLCAKSTGLDTGSCGEGIDLFTADTKFLLYSTDAQTTPAAFLADFNGFNFTSVDLDVDVPYAAK
jgi:hypothetical protein